MLHAPLIALCQHFQYKLPQDIHRHFGIAYRGISTTTESKFPWYKFPWYLLNSLGTGEHGTLVQQTFFQDLLHTGKIWAPKSSLEYYLPYSYFQTLLQLTHFTLCAIFPTASFWLVKLYCSCCSRKKIFFPPNPKLLWKSGLHLGWGWCWWRTYPSSQKKSTILKNSRST